MVKTTNNLLLPKGWVMAGSRPKDYNMGFTEAEAHSGSGCGVIESVKETATGFGTLMQGFKADEFLGERIQLTGWVKAQDVGSWAGMWMRIDGPDGENKSKSFDNMEDRPIRGTSDWTQYKIVLDVPRNSLVIAFGVLLDGKGTVWMDDFAIEVVGKDVPLTNLCDEETCSDKWVNEKMLNLDFSD